MTTIAAGPLSDALQALIDARLDTIDRMLLGRVNRHDRLAIVREVESQIFDLLPQSGAEALDRDDVLAVLGRLDPPEAYLPDESTVQPGPVRAYARPASPSRPEPSRLPLVSGILGLIAIFLLMLVAGLILGGGFGMEEVALVLIGGLVMSSFVTAILAVVFAVRVRLRGGWSIVGLVTGILSLVASIVAGIGLILEIY